VVDMSESDFRASCKLMLKMGELVY
jgi:hypothetical protein